MPRQVYKFGGIRRQPGIPTLETDRANEFILDLQTLGLHQATTSSLTIYHYSPGQDCCAIHYDVFRILLECEHRQPAPPQNTSPDTP
jgi:hypothetical protein